MNADAPAPDSPLPTIGEIARRAKCGTHRVIYIIDRDGIAPAGRAGNIRVFSEADAARIVAEARKIESGRIPRAVAG